jgi:cytochrome c oxidase cbb3-type subunit 3
MSNPLAKAGAKTFAQNCGFCHGDDATGSRGPDLVRSLTVNHDNQGDLIDPIVRNGRIDKGMPSFSAGTLSDQALAEIVAFLHARTYEAKHSAGVRDDYPVARLLTGNADQGKAYFSGAGGCSGCHSVDGDLKGIAARYQPLELQQHFLYPGPTGAPNDRTATITLPSGKTIEGHVVHLDEFSIAIRDSDGWYHSWNRKDIRFSLKDPLAAHRELLAKYTDDDVHNLFAYLESLK